MPLGKVTAIVPAFNEAERIGGVLSVLATHPLVAELLVVDDGSTDGTAEVAARFPVRVIRNAMNIGKGASLERAVHISRSGTLFFCDADVIGLTPEIVTTIVTPVLEGRCDMSVGVRGRKLFMHFPFLARTLPVIGGERALTRALWERVPLRYKNHFEIEMALNFFARVGGKGRCVRVIPGMGHVIKEEKYGLVRGALRRLFLITDVAAAYVRLRAGIK